MHPVTALDVYIAFVIPGAIACLDALLHKSSTFAKAKVPRTRWLLAGVVFTAIGLTSPVFALVYLLGPHRKLRAKSRRRRPPVPLAGCPYCHGTDKERCNWCQGTGWEPGPVLGALENCSVCHGRGTTRHCRNNHG